MPALWWVGWLHEKEDALKSTEYDFQHSEDVAEILNGLRGKQTRQLASHAINSISWGRYSFLTPEETASLALDGFAVGDTHGC